MLVSNHDIAQSKLDTHGYTGLVSLCVTYAHVHTYQRTTIIGNDVAHPVSHGYSTLVHVYT